MSEIKCLLKRAKTLKARKDARAARKSPDLVMIFYDWARKTWVVKESFFRRNGTGKVIYGGIEKTRAISHYSKYLFNENNHAARVTLDTLSCPDLPEEEQDLYVFCVNDIRRELGIEKDKAFTIDRVMDSTGVIDSPDLEEETYFYATVYDREAEE